MANNDRKPRQSDFSRTAVSEDGKHPKKRARPPNFSRKTHHAQNQTRPPFQQTKPQRGHAPPKFQPPAQNRGTNGRSPKTHYKIHRQTSQIPINPKNNGGDDGKRPNRAENHADHPPKTRQSWGDTGDATKMDETPSKKPRKLQKTKNKTENQKPTDRQQIDKRVRCSLSKTTQLQNRLNTETRTTHRWMTNMENGTKRSTQRRT